VTALEYLPPTAIAKFKIQEFRLRWTGIIPKADVLFKIMEGNIWHIAALERRNLKVSFPDSGPSD
jgi:hypothetical protein